MNDQRLVSGLEFLPGYELCDESLYYQEVVQRLEKSLGTDLSFEECMALLGVLDNNTFVYSDGFIINDLSDVEHHHKMIGITTASLISSYFCGDQSVDSGDICQNYLWGTGKDERTLLMHKIIARIMNIKDFAAYFHSSQNRSRIYPVFDQQEGWNEI